MGGKNGWDPILHVTASLLNLGKLFNPPLQGQCPHDDTKYSLPDFAEGETFIFKLQTN